jgi:ketosteroid isomerase-like protein
MNEQSSTGTNEDQVRQVLEQWADATRKGQHNEVLARHFPDVLIYDVLSPMKYDGAEAYRRSWDQWQPDTQGEGQFELQDISVTAGTDVAFAHCFIKCGGTLPDGKTFDDLVRATFCLRKASGSWKVAHQHISKPFQFAGAKP